VLLQAIRRFVDGLVQVRAACERPQLEPADEAERFVVLPVALHGLRRREVAVECLADDGREREPSATRERPRRLVLASA
jgi:hypothetical protein